MPYLTFDDLDHVTTEAFLKEFREVLRSLEHAGYIQALKPLDILGWQQCGLPSRVRRAAEVILNRRGHRFQQRVNGD